MATVRISGAWTATTTAGPANGKVVDCQHPVPVAPRPARSTWLLVTTALPPGGLFTHFAERFGIKRTEAGEFFDGLQQLTEQELLRCGEFVLPGVAKLVVQQRERRMGRNPATGAMVEIPAKQVVKVRIAKQLKDVVEAQTP